MATIQQVRRISPDSYHRIAKFALYALVAIVLTGAAVRLTGSGLGCSDWPNCEQGSLVPRDATDLHPMVEFLNRIFTGVVSIAVILAVLGSLLRNPRNKKLTWLSIGLVSGVLGQIVLGGITVLFDLWPPLVMGHFLLSMVLVANAVWLERVSLQLVSGKSHVTVLPRSERNLTWIVIFGTALVVIAGTVVTASGPHAGDAQVDRLGPALDDVARIHGFLALSLPTVLVYTLRQYNLGGISGKLSAHVRFLLIALVAQGILGYIQYFTGVPAGLVIFHILGAVVVWIYAIRLAFLVSAGKEAVDSSVEQK